MKKILLLLLTLSSFNLMVAKASDDHVIFRVNGIYVEEIIEDGDEGIGATAELAFVIQQTEDVYQTIGFEAGLISSDAEEFGLEIDTDLIPVFVNYTIGGHLGDTGFIVESGLGVGAVFADFDTNFAGSDDDVVFGGQAFGRIGYKLVEAVRLSVGVRYMISDDASLSGTEVTDTLNSFGVDAGLSFAF